MAPSDDRQGCLAFLPLAVSAARAAADNRAEPPVHNCARVVRQRAEEVERAAADCWLALLGDCDSPARRALPATLRTLSDAAADYAGTSWWQGDGRQHQRRVSAAEEWVGEALADGDGEGFAEAFAGYDDAVARALVAAPARAGSQPR